jgi:hypothetical protein
MADPKTFDYKIGWRYKTRGGEWYTCVAREELHKHMGWGYEYSGNEKNYFVSDESCEKPGGKVCSSWWMSRKGNNANSDYNNGPDSPLAFVLEAPPKKAVKEKQPMKLEVGKSYRNGDGVKVDIIGTYTFDKTKLFIGIARYMDKESNEYSQSFEEDGTPHDYGTHQINNYTLVEVWRDKLKQDYYLRTDKGIGSYNDISKVQLPNAPGFTKFETEKELREYVERFASTTYDKMYRIQVTEL